MEYTEGKEGTPNPPSSPHSRQTDQPTSRKEIWAWWAYMIAIEPISVVVLQLFLLLILEALPKLVGHLAGHPTSPCTGEADEHCLLFEMGALQVTGSAFSYGVITLAVAVQALVFICFGALADYGSMRRHLLACSTVIGSLLCMATLLIRGRLAALIAGLLTIGINISFGVSLMLYNSYLPLLAAHHPKMHSFVADSPMQMRRYREAISNSMSTKSFVLGYSSAILVLALCAGYIFWQGDTFGNVLVCVGFCGLWWGLGSIFSLLSLQERRGPALPLGANRWTFSFKKTLATLRKCNRLPHTFFFLAAFFLYADGCNTVGQVAVLFARSELNLPYEQLIYCALLAPFSGVLGNFFFLYLQRHLKLSSKRMIVIILFLFSFIPFYGAAGIFFDSFGLHHQWECYMLAVCYGFLMGAMQSSSRVVFGELIPPGEEAEFFSLYAITDKGSSWLGPLIQATMTTLTGQQRYGLIILGLMIIGPLPLLIWKVDMERGKQDATSLAEHRFKHSQQCVVQR